MKKGCNFYFDALAEHNTFWMGTIVATNPNLHFVNQDKQNLSKTFFEFNILFVVF